MISKLNPRQKIAILMVALPHEIAAQILREFNTMQAEEISSEISRLPIVSPEIREAVVKEFLASNKPPEEKPATQNYFDFDFPQNSLYKKLAEGEDRKLYNNLLEKKSETLRDIKNLNPLKFLGSLKPKDIVTLLKRDHPQTIALVISYLKPVLAFLVLRLLPFTQQIEVAKRVSDIRKVDSEILAEIEIVLQNRLRKLIDGSLEYIELDGREVLLNILSMADKDTEVKIINGIMRKYPGLGKDLKKKLCNFEDIQYISNKDLREVIRLADLRDLVLALKGADEKLLKKVFRSLGENSAKLLKEDIEAVSLKTVDYQDIRASQHAIRNILRGLVKLGKIKFLQINS